MILRDSNGIAQVRAITGSKILRVLKANGELYQQCVVYTYVALLCIYNWHFFTTVKVLKVKHGIFGKPLDQIISEIIKLVRY